MTTFGGEMRMVLSNDQKLTMRGNYAREGSHYEITTVTNQDGSLSRQVGLKPYRLTCDLEHRPGFDYDALLRLDGINATVVKAHSSRRDLYTDGFFEGTPSINEVEGTVTGLVFVARKHRELVS